VLTPEEFDRLLGACGQSGEPQEWATARNRAILWVLLDTGIRVSELCELRLGDMDRTLGRLRIRGNRARERELTLSPQGRHQMLSYLDEHRCKSGSAAGGRGGEEYLFLTETYQPVTKNALTLLFDRLRKRAGITEKAISPSVLRDTCAVGYLQAGGTLEALGERLGVRDRTALKRYERAARPSSQAERGSSRRWCKAPRLEQACGKENGAARGPLRRQRAPSSGREQIRRMALGDRRWEAVEAMIREHLLKDIGWDVSSQIEREAAGVLSQENHWRGTAVFFLKGCKGNSMRNLPGRDDFS
jgi:hypothetical protein